MPTIRIRGRIAGNRSRFGPRFLRASRFSRKGKGASRSIRVVRRSVPKRLRGQVVHHFKDRNPFAYVYQATYGPTTWPSANTTPSSTNVLLQVNGNDAAYAFLPKLSDSSMYLQVRQTYTYVKLNMVVYKLTPLEQEKASEATSLAQELAGWGGTDCFNPSDFPTPAGTSLANVQTLAAAMTFPSFKVFKPFRPITIKIKPRLVQQFYGLTNTAATQAQPQFDWVRDRKLQIAVGAATTPDNMIHGGALMYIGAANGAGNLQTWQLESRYYFTMIQPY